jgi:hypothetical protein
MIKLAIFLLMCNGGELFLYAVGAILLAAIVTAIFGQ